MDMSVVYFYTAIIMLAFNVSNGLWLIKACKNFKLKDTSVVMAVKVGAFLLFNSWVIAERGLVAKNSGYLFGSLIFSDSVVSSAGIWISFISSIVMCLVTIRLAMRKEKLVKKIGSEEI